MEKELAEFILDLFCAKMCVVALSGKKQLSITDVTRMDELATEIRDWLEYKGYEIKNAKNQ